MHFICPKEDWMELKVCEILSQEITNFVQNTSFLFYSIYRNDDTKTEAYRLLFHCYVYSSVVINGAIWGTFNREQAKP